MVEMNKNQSHGILTTPKVRRRTRGVETEKEGKERNEVLASSQSASITQEIPSRRFKGTGRSLGERTKVNWDEMRKGPPNKGPNNAQRPTFASTSNKQTDQ